MGDKFVGIVFRGWHGRACVFATALVLSCLALFVVVDFGTAVCFVGVHVALVFTFDAAEFSLLVFFFVIFRGWHGRACVFVVALAISRLALFVVVDFGAAVCLVGVHVALVFTFDAVEFSLLVLFFVTATCVVARVGTVFRGWHGWTCDFVIALVLLCLALFAFVFTFDAVVLAAVVLPAVVLFLSAVVFVHERVNSLGSDLVAVISG